MSWSSKSLDLMAGFLQVRRHLQMKWLKLNNILWTVENMASPMKVWFV